MLDFHRPTTSISAPFLTGLVTTISAVGVRCHTSSAAGISIANASAYAVNVGYCFESLGPVEDTGSKSNTRGLFHQGAAQNLGMAYLRDHPTALYTFLQQTSTSRHPS